MSSQITPNNINQNYPVAGVDNNSQGFRDNFTSIKNNFIVTKRELDDLMNKVVVKEALTYGPAVDNDFQGLTISNVTIRAVGETTVSPVTANGAITVDYIDGSYQTLIMNGSATLTFANFPAGNARGEVRVSVVNANVAHALTLDDSVTQYLNTNNLAGYDFDNKTITFNKTGTYDLVFSSVDQGANVFVHDASNRLLGKSLTANTVITSSSLVTTGLSFGTQADHSYAFEALIPFVHSNSSVQTHTFSVQYGAAGAGTGYYVVEQQAGPASTFTANTAVTSNSTVSTVTTTSSSAKFAKISGVYSHSANSTVTITAATDGGNLTVLAGAHVRVTPLI
jgi:hypothetical protein